jgi:hypothetical protein
MIWVRIIHDLLLAEYLEELLHLVGVGDVDDMSHPEFLGEKDDASFTSFCTG